MLKLLFTLGAFLVLGLALLGLRQHRLELTAEGARLHDTIRAREQTLWGQEVEIAAKTNPLALAAGLKKAGLDLGAPAESMDALFRDPGARTPRRGAHDGDRDLIAPLRGRR